MTVAELIERLRALPSDRAVYLAVAGELAPVAHAVQCKPEEVGIDVHAGRTVVVLADAFWWGA